MIDAKRFCSRIFLATFCVVSGGVSDQLIAQVIATDDAAVRAVAQQFFAAYAGRDLDRFMKLWSVRSPEIESRRRAMQESFAATDNIDLVSLAISDLTIDGDKVRVRVAVEMTALDAKTSKPATGFGKMNRSLRLVKESDGWKVWSESSSEQELASVLVDEKTDEERRARLAADRQLMTPDLRKALIAKADSLIEHGDFSRAMVAARFAYDVAQQIDDKAGIAAAMDETADVYIYQSNYEMALEYYQKCLPLYQSLGDRDKAINALSGIGMAHILQHNFDLAQEDYQKILTAAQEINNKHLAASSLGNLGVIKDFQGNYGVALEYYRKSLALNEEVDSKTRIAAMLGNIGSVYQSLGNYDLALDYSEKSLALRESIGFKPMIPLALANIGKIYRARGDFNKAIEYFRKSLTIAEEIKGKEDTEYAQSLIGEIAALQGNTELALDFLQKSLATCEEVGNNAGSARRLNSIGDVYTQRGDYTKALDAFDRAAAIARPRNMREELWQSRLGAGQAYRGLTQFEQARQAFEEAIATIESLRGDVAGGAQQQESAFENKVSPYQAMVDLLIAQNKFDEALVYAERSKARALLDVVSSGRINVTKAMTSQEREKERDLDSRLVSLNSQITTAAMRAQPDAARLAALKADLQKARLDREAFHTMLYAAHPELKAKRGQVQPISMQEAAALLPDAHSALLEYVVTADKTYLFVLTRDQKSGGSRKPQTESANRVDAQTANTQNLIPTLKVYTLNIKRQALTERAEAFRRQLATRDLRFSPSAVALYDLLIKPAREQLQGRNSVLIVPDAALWQFPFQALQSAQNHYLLEDAAVAYAPSLTVLREMNRLRKRPSGQTAGSLTLLAVGNPELGHQTLERVKSANRDEKLGPLPEAEREARALGQMYGPNHSKVYVGADAREDRIKAEASKFTVLHLATHGILDDASPMYSHLVLSQTEGAKGAGEDGLLEAWEMMNLDLQADLAVLSACETARGRVAEGEGVVGMSWALFVAGCPTAMVSQWKVDSASTTKLMLAFHKELQNEAKAKGQINVAQSLRKAALGLLHGGEYLHPFYWAGFVVVGAGL